jgi:hypothetical protein
MGLEQLNAIGWGDTVSVIPVYIDPEKEGKDFGQSLSEVFGSLADTVDENPAVVVSDGRTLRGRLDIDGVVSTIILPDRLGKAEAVRAGYIEALKKYPDAQIFIQGDGDGDPKLNQAREMIASLSELNITRNDLVMMLGERDQALKNNGYWDSHREVLFRIQNYFSGLLGLSHVTDATTGLRAATRPLVEKMVKFGRGKNFGSDVDQLIMCALFNATVVPYKLKDAGQRPSQTPLFKFDDCREALLSWEPELRERNYNQVVDVFGYGDPDVIAQLVQSSFAKIGGSLRGQARES